MAKGDSRLAVPSDGGRPTVNTDAPERKVDEAEVRVLHVQRKLHKWATIDPQKRFDDLFNLVCDQATLEVAWSKVRGNKGSRTAGVDAMTRYHVERRYGVDRLLNELREELKSRTFQPLPVKERGIPKKTGKVRYLGIPALVTAWCKWPLSWCWSRYSKSTSTLLPMATALGGEARTPSLRSFISRIRPPVTNGSSKAIWKHVSTALTIAP